MAIEVEAEILQDFLSEIAKECPCLIFKTDVKVQPFGLECVIFHSKGVFHWNEPNADSMIEKIWKHVL